MDTTHFLDLVIIRQSPQMEMEMENEQNLWVVVGNDIKVTLF